MTDQPTEIQNIINELKKSPIFNLSLSSKELFHSNFLSWLAENYNEYFGYIFIEYLKEEPLTSRIQDIKREKKNIDLSFKYSNDQELLIENKIKSIPYAEQLIKYSKTGNKNQNYILLSLSEPKFFTKDQFIIEDDNLDIVWHYFSYKKLSKVLTELVAKIKDNYHTGLINDYIGFIDELIKIDELCQINKNDMFDFHNDDSNGYILKKLKEIRLHDFYLKRKYELLAFKIYSKLEENKKPLLAFNKKLDWNSFDAQHRIFIGFGMTRSLGLLDMKYRISNNLILGIQIQGEHFRLVIEDNTGEQARIIKEKILNDGLWFNFASSFENPKIYPLENYKQKFNKYGKIFFYRSVKLGTDKTVDEIINIVLSYIDQIEKNLEQIEKKVTTQ